MDSVTGSVSVSVSVSADTDDLDRFVERGRRQAAVLQTVRCRVGGQAAMVESTLAWSPPGPSALAAIDALRIRADRSTSFVASVSDALRAFDPDPDTPFVSAPAAVVDAGLDRRGTASFEVAAATYRRIADIVDAGDDLAMTNGELNRVTHHLATLDDDQLPLVVDSLTERQLEVVFHNVHSSGFWSNDWNDRERTDFYHLLDPLPTASKARVGAVSPYLEALAVAEAEVAGRPQATTALVELRAVAGFAELDFDRRAAVLWQAAHHPSEPAITNLGRLVDRPWFQRFDLADTQRSAKLVGYLSDHRAGDPVVVANTLDRFLDPDAPYRFDWERTGTAYGSAHGEEAHFNRAYLDAGNGSVADSIPTGVTAARTERMLTHTVAHEVNHLINGDRRTESYDYFMGEYRAYWVGHLAQHGTSPTRGDVEARVETFFTAGPDHSYHSIATAVDDPVEGPRIAGFAEGILGRPVGAADLAAEITVGVTGPDMAAPAPVPVDGGPNNVDNTPPNGVVE